MGVQGYVNSYDIPCILYKVMQDNKCESECIKKCMNLMFSKKADYAMLKNIWFASPYWELGR